MPPESDTVLWITTATGCPPEQPGVTPLSRLEFECLEPAELEQRLADLSGSTGPPLVSVIDQHIEKPLRVARTLHRSLPLTQILFLVPADRLASFRSELSVAPMIGTNWTVIDAGSSSRLMGALASAAKSSRERRQLRTNLDAINVRLAGPRPTSDSSEYRKLVISDKYLATILEHAQDAIVSLDLQGRIASWNRGATLLFGYSHKEALDLRIADLAEDDSGKLAGWFGEAIRGRPTEQVEIAGRRKDGSRFTAEVTIAPVRDESGETMAVSLLARDITARKQTEEELRSIQAELEQRVIKRTEALHYLNAELEAFTYSASHDLRAPLRGIDGFSQALIEDYGQVLDESAAHYVERIRSGAQRMGEIIDAMLMLSRISTVDLNLSYVDIGRLTREIGRELQEAQPDRRVELKVQPNLVVRADPQLMRIALQNLLSNAWKFTRERDPAEITVGRSDEGGESAFFVRDNGAGFDMAYAEKLFAPFQRIHHPSRFEGSGIGLGTVQRVINRHGGKVWGVGHPDEGATFYFQLPNEPVGNRVASSRNGE